MVRASAVTWPLLLVLACSCLAEERASALDARAAVERLAEPGQRSLWGFAALWDLLAPRRSLVVARRPPKRPPPHRAVVKRPTPQRKGVVRKMPPHHKHKGTVHIHGDKMAEYADDPKHTMVLLAFLLGMMLIFACFYCLESAHMDSSRYSSYSAMNHLDPLADANSPSTWGRQSTQLRGGLFGRSRKALTVEANVVGTWFGMARRALPSAGVQGCCSSERDRGGERLSELIPTEKSRSRGESEAPLLT